MKPSESPQAIFFLLATRNLPLLKKWLKEALRAFLFDQRGGVGFMPEENLSHRHLTNAAIRISYAAPTHIHALVAHRFALVRSTLH